MFVVLIVVANNFLTPASWDVVWDTAFITVIQTQGTSLVGWDWGESFSAGDRGVGSIGISAFSLHAALVTVDQASLTAGIRWFMVVTPSTFNVLILTSWFWWDRITAFCTIVDTVHAFGGSCFVSEFFVGTDNSLAHVSSSARFLDATTSSQVVHALIWRVIGVTNVDFVIRSSVLTISACNSVLQTGLWWWNDVTALISIVETVQASRVCSFCFEFLICTFDSFGSTSGWLTASGTVFITSSRGFAICSVVIGFLFVSERTSNSCFLTGLWRWDFDTAFCDAGFTRANHGVSIIDHFVIIWALNGISGFSNTSTFTV
jgi:hypothetical protein